MTPAQLFSPPPPTPLDIMHRYRAVVADRLELMLGKSVKLNTQLAEATDELATIDAAISAAEAQPSGQKAAPDLTTLEEEVAALVNTGILDRDGITVTATSGRVSPDVDPLTGEVAPDTGVVTVVGTGCEPFTCAVGSRTRFSALVFAYAEQAGIRDVDPAVWRILDPSDHEVDGGILIPRTSWGCTYVIERTAAQPSIPMEVTP